jgi:hypothetical protein
VYFSCVIKHTEESAFWVFLCLPLTEPRTRPSTTGWWKRQRCRSAGHVCQSSLRVTAGFTQTVQRQGLQGLRKWAAGTLYPGDLVTRSPRTGVIYPCFSIMAAQEGELSRLGVSEPCIFESKSGFWQSPRRWTIGPGNLLPDKRVLVYLGPWAIPRSVCHQWGLL